MCSIRRVTRVTAVTEDTSAARSSARTISGPDARVGARRSRSPRSARPQAPRAVRPSGAGFRPHRTPLHRLDRRQPPQSCSPWPPARPNRPSPRQSGAADRRPGDAHRRTPRRPGPQCHCRLVVGRPAGRPRHRLLRAPRSPPRMGGALMWWQAREAPTICRAYPSASRDQPAQDAKIRCYRNPGQTARSWT